ncbi:MAG: hypothetical protein LBU11_00785 [Zoogloeaceae bacterium]|jgi:hypothetical protein|nr:hypothetical protein [Zoogloeaceae bacterium]
MRLDEDCCFHGKTGIAPHAINMSAAARRRQPVVALRYNLSMTCQERTP